MRGSLHDKSSCLLVQKEKYVYFIKKKEINRIGHNDLTNKGEFEEKRSCKNMCVKMNKEKKVNKINKIRNQQLVTLNSLSRIRIVRILHPTCAYK